MQSSFPEISKLETASQANYCILNEIIHTYNSTNVPLLRIIAIKRTNFRENYANRMKIES